MSPLFYFVDSRLVLSVWNNFQVRLQSPPPCPLYFLTQMHSVLTAVFDFLITVCFFHSYYETKAVFLAMGITAVVCIAVTVFCFQTKVEGDVKCVCLCRSVACGPSEDVFVVSVKERFCLTLQWGTEFL